ncbi:alpha-mannosidase [Neobacillus sp. 19]|uniref:alpha-mannosidase n=1 Tax=Neobacillus sp. 19 TaxID=3394458 RepID=UPI003BF6949B
MFYMLDKVKSRIEELNDYRYQNREGINEWFYKEDETKSEKYPPKVDETWNVFRRGETWSGRDYYIWLSSKLSIPDSKDDEFVLLFNFGKTDGGTNSGFESLLFINGVPYQGVDANHKEVFIDKRFYGTTIDLSLKLWSGLEGGGPPRTIKHDFKYSDIASLQPDVDDLYYTAKMVLETAQILDKNDPNKVILEKALAKTFTCIDWSEPGSESFYQSCIEANDTMQREIEKLDKHTPVTVTAIGHTHIDVAWLWRLKHTREKAARSFSTVLRLMERYPDYYFLQSQPQLYSYMKKDYPEIYEQIKQRVADGSWEIDGGMWLEADCNIPSGESIVRQLLHGTQFMKNEFDKEPNFLWLPDVFGYSWALPQILVKSNLKAFMTTKISWNQFNRMPHDTFWWKGIDGSKILTHFITTPEPEDYGTDSFHYTYNGVLEPKTVKGVYDNYIDKNINQEMLVCYGHGDGGGGVNREMLEQRRRLDKIPGLPHVKTGSAKQYFENLRETVENTDEYVHTWDGELYLEYHRGTYTSQAFVKKFNRKLELGYREAEFLRLWALKENGQYEYPMDKLHDGWEIILRNQFHDIIPGSSIHEVYEDARIEYGVATEILERINEEFRCKIVNNQSNEWNIFNSNAWERSDFVFIPETTAGLRFVNHANQPLESVELADGYRVYVPNIPSLGYETIKGFSTKEGTAEAEVFIVEERKVETPFYVIEWNTDGQLVGLLDKETGREVLAGKGNVFQLFEDKPMNFDAWDIDIYYSEKMKEITASEITVNKKNHLFVEIEFTYQFGKSDITQTMIVSSKSKRIDFKTKVNWNERQQLLKVAFPVNVRTTEATYDIQFGNVKRPTHWNTSWDMARFESVAHQWVDLSEYQFGVSLLNDSKYGHDIKDNVIRLTLLKGAIDPDPTADVGEHEFTYSLYPHSGDFIQANTVQEAWAVNCPLEAVSGTVPFVQQQLITFMNEPKILIDAIKKAENSDGVIVRFHDYTGGTQKVTFKANFPFSSWTETDLMENPIGDLVSTNEVDVTVKPFEIKTLLFTV